jgi:hypothetical protein
MQNPLAATIAVINGIQKQLLVDKQGDLIASQLHGRKYLAAYQAELAFGANPSGVTTSAGLATTYVGLCLSNPAGSGKNLAVRRVTGQLNVAEAALTAIGLIVGFAAGGITVHTTALVPQLNPVGNAAAPAGLLDSACTLVGTPAWAAWMAETPSATGVVEFMTDLEGGLLLPPGAYCAIGTSIAGPASGFLGSMEWEEFPV